MIPTHGLWPRVAPGLLDNDDICLSLVSAAYSTSVYLSGPEKIIFGTGIGYGRLPAVDNRWKIYCVRGPLTAQALGLPPDMAVTDAAALAGTAMGTAANKAYPVSFHPTL